MCPAHTHAAHAGEIVGSFAHYHAGAINLTTSTDQGVVCTNQPVLDSQNRIVYIPHCELGNKNRPHAAAEEKEKEKNRCSKAFAKDCKYRPPAASGEFPIKVAKGDKVHVEMVSTHPMASSERVVGHWSIDCPSLVLASLSRVLACRPQRMVCFVWFERNDERNACALCRVARPLNVRCTTRTRSRTTASWGSRSS